MVCHTTYSSVLGLSKNHDLSETGSIPDFMGRKYDKIPALLDVQMQLLSYTGPQLNSICITIHPLQRKNEYNPVQNILTCCTPLCFISKQVGSIKY
jgi:hypothetical protein